MDDIDNGLMRLARDRVKYDAIINHSGRDVSDYGPGLLKCGSGN